MEVVYVITKGNYSDYHICAITLDLNRAETLKKMYSDSFDEAEIETYKLNEANHRQIIGVMFNSSGAFVRFVGNEYDLWKAGAIEDWTGDDVTIWVEAKDFDHAKKIAQDKLAEYKAKKEGIV